MILRCLSFSVLLLLPGFSFSGKAQGPVQVTLDSSQALIGSPLKLRLDAGPLPQGSTVQWPQMPDSFSALAFTSPPKADTVAVGGQIRYIREYTVTGLDSGIFEVPALSFGIASGGAVQQVQSTPVAVHLYPMAVDTSKPIDPIRDIVTAPQTRNWKPWAIGVAAALLLGILAWLFLRKKKKPEGSKTPVRPAKGFAEQLHELEAQALPEKGEYRLHYTRLVEILRDALAAKHGLTTREITSAQLLRKTEKLLPEMAQRQLQALLNEADAVKFAKVQPDVKTQKEALQLARAFLENARIAS